MRWRRESRLALVLGLVTALLLGAFLSGAAGADRKGGAVLRREQARLSARSHRALLGLYALDSRLARARSDLARLRNRADALRTEEQRIRKEAAIVEGNLRASQRLLGNRLLTLYEEGEPSALAVLLGASSLDDAVSRLEDLDRSARQGARAVTDSQQGRAKLDRLAAKLASNLREAQALAARAEQATTALAHTRAEHVAYIASLARQRRLNAREIASLDSRARRVVERAQTVQAHSAAITAPTPAPLAVGTRTLTVSATGYSLPGHTSTGLPVGPGVVAVDPVVIPLGARMTIPGYGEGVAADTGSAVQGYTVDLWFPTLADALAWGRRTVTIALH